MIFTSQLPVGVSVIFFACPLEKGEINSLYFYIVQHYILRSLNLTSNCTIVLGWPWHCATWVRPRPGLGTSQATPISRVYNATHAALISLEKLSDITNSTNTLYCSNEARIQHFIKLVGSTNCLKDQGSRDVIIGKGGRTCPQHGFRFS